MIAEKPAEPDWAVAARLRFDQHVLEIFREQREVVERWLAWRQTGDDKLRRPQD
jgi:hypothetical protein